MSENESVVKKLIKKITEIELKTAAGQVNFAFGLLMGCLLILVFAGSLFEKVAEVILAFFGVQSPWESWVPLAALLICVFYFLLSVLIVAYFESRHTGGSPSPRS